MSDEQGILGHRVGLRCRCGRFSLLFLMPRQWTAADGSTHRLDACMHEDGAA